MQALYMEGAAALGIALLTLWIISIFRGHVSFIDAFWGTGFIITSLAAARSLPQIGQAQAVALLLLSLWGIRLSYHLLKRYLAHGEDHRYVKIMGKREGVARHLYSLGIVFILQGSLILIIVSPIIGLLARGPQSIDLIGIFGILAWATGLFFEAVGDHQLARFKADPANEGKVLTSGLWAWTRHPNYFGDACVWWGLWLIGHDLTLIFAPILMSFILMKWSGVPMLERSMKKRRPGYEAYMKNTPAFFPKPPRKS